MENSNGLTCAKKVTPNLGEYSSSDSSSIQRPYRVIPAFRNLLPKLPAENRARLKANILAHGGCLGPVVVWSEEAAVLDGHHRLEIVDELRAEGHAIAEPSYVLKSFTSEWQAKLWTIHHQDGSRPDWNAARTAMLIAANKPLVDAVVAAANERMKAGKKADPVTASKRGRTVDILAEAAGVGRTTMYEAQQVIKHQDLVKEVEDGKLTMHQAYQAIVSASLREQDAFDAQKAASQKPEFKTDSSGMLNRIHHADVLDGITKVANESVSLVFTSPKYPLTTVRYADGLADYDGDYLAYLSWMEQVIRECHRVLMDGGRLVLNFDDVYPQGNVKFPDGAPAHLRMSVFFDFFNICQKIGLRYRDIAIWYKQNAVGTRPMVGSQRNPSCPRLQNNWEFIVVWSKGAKSKRPQRKDKKPRDLIDMSRDEFFKWTMGLWDIKPVGRQTSRHRAAFPEALAERVIKLYTFVGDTVLDPFSGSGTTCAVAARWGRQYIGIDIVKEYVDRATSRVHAAKAEATNRQPPQKRRAKVKIDIRKMRNNIRLKTGQVLRAKYSAKRSRESSP